MRKAVLQGWIGWCVGSGALMFAAAGCAPSDERTEEQLGQDRQALTLTIDGEEWTRSAFGATGPVLCTQVVDAENTWSQADGEVSVVGAIGRGVANPTLDDPAVGCARCGKIDSVNFLSKEVQGNFELTVRVTSVSGVTGAEVGVMIRENIESDGAGPMGALQFKRAAAQTCSPEIVGTFAELVVTNRVPVDEEIEGEDVECPYVLTSESVDTRSVLPGGGPEEPPGAPLWLSIQRYGDDFSVAHARDVGGRPGTWVANGGGAFIGTAHVGIFAAANLHHLDVENPTSATFDHLSIREEPSSAPPYAGLRYRTGSLGASLVKGSGASEERLPIASVSSGNVSTGMSGFYVAPTGTSYKLAHTTDPKRYEIELIRSGGEVAKLASGLSFTPFFVDGAIAGSCEMVEDVQDCSLYVAEMVFETGSTRPEARIHRLSPSLEPLQTLSFPTHEDRPVRIRGLSARGNTVFVSDYGRPSNQPYVQQEGGPPPDPDERQNCVVNSATCNTSTPQLEGTSCQVVPCTESQFVHVVVDGTQTCKVPFERPGSSVVDHHGNGWVIRSATPYHEYGKNVFNAFKAKYETSIVCIQPDCQRCVKPNCTCPPPNGGTDCDECKLTIEGVENPVALAVDSQNRLYVADNGAAQNIRIYYIDDPAGDPGLLSTIGTEGGVFSGSTPGLVVDPNDGGDHRFYSLLGIGFDDDDNLYVASNAPRTAIQKFPKDGDLSWGAAEWNFYGLGREIGAFVEDASGNTSYYTRTRRLSLDPDSASSDFSWKHDAIIRPPYSVSSDLPAVPPPSTHLSFGAALRVRQILDSEEEPLFGGARFLFEIEDVNAVRIYRFVDELIKPCGHIIQVSDTLRELWFDDDEDGSWENDEASELHPLDGRHFTAEAAEDGSIWLSSNLDSMITELTVTAGPSETVPTYAVRRTASFAALFPVVPPSTFADVRPRFRFENNTNALYLLGWLDDQTLNPVLVKACPNNSEDEADGCVDECTPENQSSPECCTEPPCPASCNGDFKTCCTDEDFAPRKCLKECQACGAKSCRGNVPKPIVLKYTGWREAGISDVPERQEFTLPNPFDTADEPDDFMRRSIDPDCGCNDWTYTSFDVAGDKIFAQELHGTIHIHDSNTGAPVDRLYAGPEGSGTMGWPDQPNWMNVFKRPNSDEYLVTTIDSLHRGRNLTFKWKQLDLGEECWDPHQCKSGYCVDDICCASACDGDTQCVSFDCVNFEDNPGYCAGVLQPEGAPCNDGDPETSDDQCREYGECAGDPTAANIAPLAWYVADETDLTLSNGKVAAWADRSGNGFHVSNDNYYGQPAYDATGWNETQPTVTFNGGNLLRRFGWAGPGAGTNGEFSILSVIRSAGAHNGSVAAWWPEAGASYDSVRASVVMSGGSGFFDLAREEDTGAGPQNLTTAEIDTGRHVVVWRYSPQVMKITVDGTTYEESDLPPIGAISVDMFLIGARTNLSTWHFQGDISELIVIGSNVSDQHVVDFRSYAKSRWEGLP